MSFRLFLRCCFSNKHKDQERKTEINIKKALNDSRDNSFDKSALDQDNLGKPKEEIKELQQSQPIPEEYLKTTIQPFPEKKDTIQINKQIEPPKEEKKTHDSSKIVKEGTMAPINYDDFTVISDEIDKKGKKLTLKVIESNSLMKDSIILITPAGYKESKRKSKDGKVAFGTVLEGKIQNEEPFMNDFVLPTDENGFGKRHFIISYIPSN